MHLERFSVRGFRSLADVENIPISGPTILAGPNDGGKTATVSALAFLVGDYLPTEEDRTYLEGESGLRCPLTEVVGHFRLDEWEQGRLALPAEVAVRRRVDAELAAVYEIWTALPDDEELRALHTKLVPELKELVKKFGLRPEKPTKPFLLAALHAYGAEHSSGEGWTGVASGLIDRLPRIAAFEGRGLEPEAAVKSALTLRLKDYLAEDAMRSRVQELEVDAQQWLAIEAKPLADHIVARCGDIASVTVDPKVAISHYLQTTSLRLERSSGELVRLDRSGLGSARRISMAVWEATTEMLVEQQQTDDDVTESGPPVQVIVVYDEPDTHLDYHYQREVMRLIRDQGKVAHVSVVVATHSMNLIDGVDISDVVLLALDERRRTRVERLGTGDHDSFDRHLGAVAAAVGLRNSVLLHERCFFAVEGDTEQQAIPILFSLSEGLPLQAAGVALWSCGGNAGALQLAEYLHKHGRTVVLMLDADSEEQDAMFRTASLQRRFGQDYDDMVLMLKNEQGAKELEELFDDKTWADTANEAWPHRDRQWFAEDFAALRGQNKFSDRVRSLLREHSEEAPARKPPLTMEIVMRLERAEDVPRELRDVFAKLRRLAG